jgi:hypothetical protein
MLQDEYEKKKRFGKNKSVYKILMIYNKGLKIIMKIKIQIINLQSKEF